MDLLKLSVMKPPANAVRGMHDVGLYSDTDPGNEVAEHFDRGTPVVRNIYSHLYSGYHHCRIWFQRISIFIHLKDRA